MTRVHVTVPAYNAAWSIGDTLRSIRAQSLTDYRVTVVDDGSTEEMGPVIAPLIADDERFRVIRQANGGLAAARNRGLAEATAPYAAFVDSDDLWHPDFLARLVEALEARRDAPFAYCHSLRVDEANRLIPGARWSYVPRHDLRGLLTLNTVGSGSAAVYRTEAIRAAGGYDTSLRERGAEGAEDWKLNLRLAARASPVLVPEYLAAYRLVARSMSQGHPARQLRAGRTVLEDLAREIDLPPEEVRHARTAMNGWLLEAFLRRREFGTVAALLVESYLRNPLWFRARELRSIHAMKVRSRLADRGERMHLADLEEAEGRRPFAFLR
ncbi:glycosyltransferase family 2 protein [Rubellimicrobium roseum]|nr:glycosyltransferase [Rubellimicrobium roseum]